jgi:uncharacterized protein (TIGR01244 family)
MKEPTKVSAKISAGVQPNEEDIAALKAAGYRKIINLRRPGEPNQPLPLDPQAQGDVVASMGMAYAHIPVDPKNLDPSSAAAVTKEIEEADGPVYIHCAAGGRAVTHALLADGKGKSSDAVFAKAEQIGAPVTDEGFKAFVKKVSDGA